MSRAIALGFLVAVFFVLLVQGGRLPSLSPVAAEETDDGPYVTPTPSPTPQPLLPAGTATPTPEAPPVVATPEAVAEFPPKPEAVAVDEAFESDAVGEIGSFAGEYVRPQREPPAPVFSFEELQSRIDALLTELPGQVSIAILRPGEGVVFSRDEARPYRLASVAKLFIMAAYLDRLAALEARPPDEFEYSLLEAMISYSDNDAAEYLWEMLGGSEGFLGYWNSRGFYDFLPADDYSWGGSADTATEAALFLSQLTGGALLDSDSTGLALSLLNLVWDTQRWGVRAGVYAVDPDATVLLKDGWYPEYDGWLVNSAGVVIPSTGAPPYAIVILGEGFLYYEDGVDAIEAIAHMANGLMLRAPDQASAPAPEPELFAGPY